MPRDARHEGNYGQCHCLWRDRRATVRLHGASALAIDGRKVTGERERPGWLMATCPACRDRSAPRQRDPLCRNCMNAAREVAHRPLWVLDSPLLRQVLAWQNLAAVPAVVRAACGLSQRDFAAVAGWSPDALGAYERGLRGGLFDIRALLPFADAIGMPRQALQALFLGDPGAGAAGDADAMPAIASPPPPVSQGRGQGPAILTPGTGGQDGLSACIRYWRACIDALHQHDRQAGGSALLRPALQLRSHAREAHPHVALGTGLPAAVGSGIALYAAQAALDAGNLHLARSLHREATALAATASDTTLTGQALLAGSLLHAHDARFSKSSRLAARQALALAREAAEECRYEPVPQLHAQIAIRVAEAAALLGDAAAFSAAIARARRELDRPAPAPADAVPAWLRHLGHGDITAAEADGTLALGDHRRAATLYREAASNATCPRDQAERDAGLAEALFLSGEHQQAIATAHRALAAGMLTSRGMSRAHQVAAAAGGLPGAPDLRTRADFATRTTSGLHAQPSRCALEAVRRVPA
jgi:tetratricopeptide (TPR) repeat protein/DNA-binding XRE family transcriptional regulator